MNIFEQKPPALQIGEYELTEGPYKGGIVKYRALLPLGYQLLHDTPLSNRLMDIKIDLQDVVAQQEYLDSLSNEASSHLTLERSIQTSTRFRYLSETERRVTRIHTTGRGFNLLYQ